MQSSQLERTRLHKSSLLGKAHAMLISQMANEERGLCSALSANLYKPERLGAAPVTGRLGGP